jgi:hypothetical protein
MRIFPGDPFCDLCHHLLLYAVEAVVGHRFTGITPALSSSHLGVTGGDEGDLIFDFP